MKHFSLPYNLSQCFCFVAFCWISCVTSSSLSVWMQLLAEPVNVIGGKAHLREKDIYYLYFCIAQKPQRGLLCARWCVHTDEERKKSLQYITLTYFTKGFLRLNVKQRMLRSAVKGAISTLNVVIPQFFFCFSTSLMNWLMKQASNTWHYQFLTPTNPEVHPSFPSSSASVCSGV